MTKYFLLIIFILLYVNKSNIQPSFTHDLDYADLYNETAAASYKVSKSRGENLSDLDSCITSKFDRAMKSGYEEGCKSQIMGNNPPKIIVLNPLKYLELVFQ